MTRIQKERFSDADEYDRLCGVYVLTEEKMRLAKPDAIIMHPLPRVNEISVKVDDDNRACYFKQTRYGKFMRMALILKLLEEKDKAGNFDERKLVVSDGAKCVNPHCILTVEQELSPLVYKDKKGVVRCAYCDSEIC